MSRQNRTVPFFDPECQEKIEPSLFLTLFCVPLPRLKIEAPARLTTGSQAATASRHWPLWVGSPSRQEIASILRSALWDCRVRTVTSYPSYSRRSLRCLPMKPVPPAIRIFMPLPTTSEPWVRREWEAFPIPFLRSAARPGRYGNRPGIGASPRKPRKQGSYPCGESRQSRRYPPLP